MVEFESALELDLIYSLDVDPSVLWFESQPLRICFSDSGGKPRHYTPDFLIHYRPAAGQAARILCEVKWLSDLDDQWGDLKERFRAAGDYAARRGWQFEVRTEHQIRTERLWNAKFLWEYCRRPEVVADHKKMLWYMRSVAPCTLAEIARYLQDLPTEVASARTTALWQLVARGGLQLDLCRRINADTTVGI